MHFRFFHTIWIPRSPGGRTDGGQGAQQRMEDWRSDTLRLVSKQNMGSRRKISHCNELMRSALRDDISFSLQLNSCAPQSGAFARGGPSKRVAGQRRAGTRACTTKTALQLQKSCFRTAADVLVVGTQGLDGVPIVASVLAPTLLQAHAENNCSE